MAFSDVGISNAIIHRQDATREQLSSLYWLSLVFGVLVFLIIFASSPVIAWFYKEPRLRELVFWVALSFVFLPVGRQFEVLLQAAQGSRPASRSSRCDSSPRGALP